MEICMLTQQHIWPTVAEYQLRQYYKQSGEYM